MERGRGFIVYGIKPKPSKRGKPFRWCQTCVGGFACQKQSYNEIRHRPHDISPADSEAQRVINPPLSPDGRAYLEQLASSGRSGFEHRFGRICLRLRLHDTLKQAELSLLYQATVWATYCNIAFNGLGGCNGEIKPESERHRSNSEQKFMTARARLYNSPGWRALPEFTAHSVQNIFLTVLVTEDNLALDR